MEDAGTEDCAETLRAKRTDEMASLEYMVTSLENVLIKSKSSGVS